MASKIACLAEKSLSNDFVSGYNLIYPVINVISHRGNTIIDLKLMDYLLPS